MHKQKTAKLLAEKYIVRTVWISDRFAHLPTQVKESGDDKKNEALSLAVNISITIGSIITIRPFFIDSA